ncbi:MAG TPA: TlpA disulfide reductase family protein [Ktedonosporobacter sp.]|nr:TlpA disulfide reductase family protein [Ktedonosporobacter sp.]
MNTALVISSIFLWLIVLANVFLTLALIRRLNRTGQSPPLKVGLQAGATAPDFAAQTLQGVTKTLADYRGQAAVLIFASPSCQPCRESLPMLQETAVEARAGGVEFVLVSGGALEATRAWDQEAGIQIPLLVATQDQNPFFQDYQITSTPTYCLLGADGKIHGSNIVGQNLDKWKLLTDSPTPVRL